MEKPFAITLDVGSSLANKTGSWRTERPVYVDRLPPCADACPAGENVQQWLYDAEEGGAGYERAWRQIMEDNPFPAVMGRVCYHPCETACNRAQLDEAVGINSVERFLGDEAIAQRLARRGPGAAVRASASSSSAPARPGSPPRTTSRRLGHAVTIYDAGPKPGGMMRFGIPRYRLPRDVLDAEIERIVDLGVDARARHARSTSILDAMREGAFDAAFLAVGAHLGKRAYIPAGSAAQDPRRGRRCSAAWRARSRRCSAGASSSTAAGTRRWTPRGPRSGSAPRRRSSSTGGPATGCRPTTSRSRRRARRAC